MINKQTILIYSITHAYANITINQTKPELHYKTWYKQSQTVSEYFNKHKQITILESDKKLMDDKFSLIKELDATYFEDKYFSTYFCMILGLNYLLHEIEDTAIRTHLSHINTKSILHEIEITKGLKEAGKNSYKYFDEVLKILEGLK